MAIFIKKHQLLCLAAAAFLLTAGCSSRKSSKPEYPDSEIRKSPIAIASVKSDNTYIKVVYGQPYRQGRTIFGSWEPYGEVWRTGANEATEITLTNPVLMNKELVEAGTYALFTIPHEEYWTIILNNDLGQWGAFEYSTNFDYKRFDVPVITLPQPAELFTIFFTEVKNKETALVLTWDLVRIEIPVVFY